MKIIQRQVDDIICKPIFTIEDVFNRLEECSILKVKGFNSLV